MTHDLPDEGQLVVYSPEGEKLIVLNEVGAAIYFLIDGSKSAEDIAHFVQETLPGAQAETYSRDVEQFLAELESHGIVRYAAAANLNAPAR